MLEFNKLKIDNDVEIIDILEEVDNEVESKLKIENLINDFCEEFKVNLNQVKSQII